MLESTIVVRILLDVRQRWVNACWSCSPGLFMALPSDFSRSPLGVFDGCKAGEDAGFRWLGVPQVPRPLLVAR